jgi:hypothetical protein
MTATQKAKLQMAIMALEQCDAWVQAALGTTDACYDRHCAIEELIDELRADMEEAEQIG